MSFGGKPVSLNPVRAAFQRCRSHFIAAATFAAVSNLLLLTPSIYMMQVYDRVLPTRGLATLAVLSAITLFALATLSLLDWLRARVLVRAGAQIEDDLAERTLRTIMSQPSLTQSQRAEALRDLDTLHQTVASPATSALFDAPWAPIYILAAFLLHPALGLLTVAAAMLMLVLAWHNERSVRQPVRAAREAANTAYARQLQISSQASEVRALGMATALTRRQIIDRGVVSALRIEASLIGGTHSSMMRFVRLSLQSGALALGAILVVEGSVSGSAVFASSLLLSRALQPIEQIVGSWKSILLARIAYEKLTALFFETPERVHTRLPAPTGAIEVERLTVADPMSGRVALADVSFTVAAGQIIGIVGLSGAGKSTLLRALSGAVPPARGHVRFDGASSADWDPDQLAAQIGYLPQDFMLFPGTVKANISRFRGLVSNDADIIDESVIAAARKIDAHEMILRLPDGYDTVIGASGVGLSAGQSQRIALARALFGNPRLLLLDEPTAHLDSPAQHAFVKALSILRQEQTTVLFATHSSDALASVDKLLLLKEGRLEKYGNLSEARTVSRPVSHVPQRASL